MSTVYGKDFDYPAQANHYRLIVANESPYAQRAAIALFLLGLDEVISYGTVFPYKTDKVWEFCNYPDQVDPVLGVKYLETLYKNTNPDYAGKYSVPALIDIESKKVVNQESLDLMYDFSTRFKAFHKNGAPDLYPEKHKDEINDMIQWLDEKIMTAGFRAGFADNQNDYDHYVNVYFDALESVDKHLQGKDWIIGNQLTAADVMLFTPLIPLDAAYATAYKLNKKQITDYPNLFAHLHKLYHIPAFNKATDFEEMKQGVFLGKNGRDIYKNEIMPIGPDQSYWDRNL